MNENGQINEPKAGLSLPEAFLGSAEKLERVRPALEAIAANEVRLYSLQILPTVSSSIRLWQSYNADKPLFAATFTAGGFDAEEISDFPLRVGALWYTDVRLRQAQKPTCTLPKEIVEQAGPLRGKLAAAALYLFENDPTLGPQITRIREGAGYLDMADDLVRYAALFRSEWDKAKNRCDVTEADLAFAEKLSPVMLEGLTAVTAKERDQRKDLRNRAAEYLCRGAEDIRAAAAYVFRKKPAALAQYPSLYIPRGKGRKPKPK